MNRTLPPHYNTFSDLVLEDLKKSGISVEQAKEYGVYPISGERYCINYNMASLVDGKPFYVNKNLNPEYFQNKYTSPKGAGNRAYITKAADDYYQVHPDSPLIMTEGEKKAIKASIEGLPVIGLRGNFGYTHQSIDSHRFQLLPELTELCRGRTKAYIIWDSDAKEKWENSFKLATERLATLLHELGLELQCLILPELNDEKTGVDDWYMVGKSTKELVFLLEANAILIEPNMKLINQKVKPEKIDLLQLAIPDHFHGIKKPNVLIEGLFHKGKIYIIGGSSKAKKSWVTLNLAQQLSVGGSFWRQQCQESKVLYFDTEMDADDLCLRKHVASPHKNLKIIRRASVPINDRTLQEVDRAKFYLTILMNNCLKHNFDVVIIDCIYKLISENDPKQMTILCDVLDDFKKAGITVFVVHHTRKGKVENGENPFNMLSGSSILSRSIDGGILLMDTDQMAIDESGCYEPAMQVHFMLRSFKYRPPEYRYFESTTGIMEFDHANTERAREEIRQNRSVKKNKKEAIEANLIEFMPIDPDQALSREEMVALANEFTDLKPSAIERRKLKEWENEKLIKVLKRKSSNYYILGEKLTARKLKQSQANKNV